MDNRKMKWLYGELPKLIKAGVLRQEDAGRIRDYYGEVDEAGGAKTALVIFGVLGAVLIGAGIILLLARNWQELSRPMRTIISLIPLIIGQLLSGWVIVRRKDSIAWQEGASSFLFIAIGVAISLIGQTYNFPGEMRNFTLTWALLGLPLVYLMDAAMPALFYMAAITAWAGFAQSEGGQSVFFWVLLALLVPYVYMKLKQDRFSNRSVFLCWAVALALCADLGITLEKVLPGIWIIAYSCYFTVLYSLGKIWNKDAQFAWQMPFHIVGGGGILVVSYILSFKWPWHNIGWDYVRNEPGYHAWAGRFDYLVAALLVILALSLFYRIIMKKDFFEIMYSSAAVLSIAAFIEVSLWSEMLVMVLYNVFLLALGIATVAKGISNRMLGTTNGGMLIIAFVAVTRFFDSDLGFVERGIAFILLGIGFLASNVIIINKRKEEV